MFLFHLLAWYISTGTNQFQNNIPTKNPTKELLTPQKAYYIEISKESATVEWE